MKERERLLVFFLMPYEKFKLLLLLPTGCNEKRKEKKNKTEWIYKINWFVNCTKKKKINVKKQVKIKRFH